MTALLIRNCQALHISATAQITLLRDQDILVRDQRIEAIQPTGQADPSHFTTVIEARGMLAMPGLINTHAHVPMVIFRGLAEDVSIERWFNEFMWPLESNLQPQDVYLGMRLGAAEMIEGGVTTVADHYFYMDEAAQAVADSGIRALLGWAIFGSSGPAMIARTGEFVARWQGAAGGRIRTLMAPHAPYTCDDDYLRACVAQAQALDVGIHIHAAEEMGQTRASLAKRGLTPIQVLEQTGVLERPTIIAHGCGLLPEDIERLRGRTVGIACAPKTYLKLAMDMTPVIALRQAGIAVGLATDGAVSNNTLDVWESLRLLALLQKDRQRSPEVLTIPEALFIATRESARVLGYSDLGALEAGFLADIILVDLSGLHHQPLHSLTASLVYNARASDVQTVIIDGRVVMQDRVFTTLDRRAAVADVQAAMDRLAQRIPAKRIQVYNP
ncbi:MAG: amidohydrolase [Anaerolineae bacterium]|jgi:5-methylthioadenosine/S-adenosylhomocysteine deaminase|nr:amidohydrolase [Anaerolineae bacterium]